MPPSLAQARARLDAYPIHEWTLVLVAATVLVVPLRGAVPAIVMAVVAAMGLATLLDRRFGPALTPAARPLAGLLAALVAWQAVGVAARRPFDAEDARALGSAVALALLFPIALAAARRDPDAPRRLLVVLLALGAVSAAISIALYVVAVARHPDPVAYLRFIRLEPFGRARHPILGAGGLAAAFLAGTALLGAARRRLPVEVALGAIALAILLTQSRGPILALLLALAGMAVLGRVSDRRRPAAAALLGLACFAVPVALVLAEPALVRLVCRGELGLCRPSMRGDVWAELVGLIPSHPWFGLGPSHRLGADTVGHAHNGLIGTAVFFGLPALALLVAAMGHALARGGSLPAGPVRAFCLGGLLFGAAYLGSDLPNPFAFLNAHWLFLWTPLVLAVAASAAPGLARWEPGREGRS
ncbi:MAG TPA: O-antigen ligase family protein [Salinarimonas sp.]|nr:O-antigen ligase family protein [Salinarimonas sp.]